MKRMHGGTVALLAVVAAGAMVAFAVSDEQRPMTVTGTLECAKCVLKEEGAKECQDVLTVANGPLVAKYYVVDKTDKPMPARGCKGKVSAQVTGLVKVEDGKMVVYASHIEPAQEPATGPSTRKAAPGD